jgi:hypothetical protein
MHQLRQFSVQTLGDQRLALNAVNARHRSSEKQMEYDEI